MSLLDPQKLKIRNVEFPVLEKIQYESNCKIRRNDNRGISLYFFASAETCEMLIMSDDNPDALDSIVIFFKFQSVLKKVGIPYLEIFLSVLDE